MKQRNAAQRNALNHYKLSGLLADPDTLDRLVIWRMNDVKYRRRTRREMDEFIRSGAMQRQFTIELRVDYADAEKNETMRTALQAAARHVYATAVLLADAVKPQIAIFSDDFFAGHEQITLLEDTIKDGLDQIGDTKEDAPSDELVRAMRDSLIK
jgi:hypothetical protein